MFGSQPRTRRPLLLILVFGAFLAIIGITATAQAILVSLHFSTGTLNTIVAQRLGDGPGRPEPHAPAARPRPGERPDERRRAAPSSRSSPP